MDQTDYVAAPGLESGLPGSSSLRTRGLLLWVVFAPAFVALVPGHLLWRGALPIEGVSGRLLGDALKGAGLAATALRTQHGPRRVALVAELPFEITPAQAALAWVAQQPGVTTVIPGARSVEQARANAAAGELPPLGEGFMAAVAELYDRSIRPLVHSRW